MPKLGALPAMLLLTLAGCAGAPSANETAAPANETGGTTNMIMQDSAAPSPGPAPSDAPPTAAPAPVTAGPRERFIVCPGNPRCPPTEGNRPSGGN